MNGKSEIITEDYREASLNFPAGKMQLIGLGRLLARLGQGFIVATQQINYFSPPVIKALPKQSLKEAARCLSAGHECRKLKVLLVIVTGRDN